MEKPPNPPDDELDEDDVPEGDDARLPADDPDEQ